MTFGIYAAFFALISILFGRFVVTTSGKAGGLIL